MVFDKNKSEESSASDNEGRFDSMELLSLIERASGTGTALAPKKAWADNIVTISFKGIRCISKSENANGDGSHENELICTSEAILKVRKPSKFASLNGIADRDVSYHPGRGEFALRMQRAVGKPILDTLKSRIKAIDRFVNFLEALDSAKGTITTESVTLRQIAFYYNAGGVKETSDGQEKTSKEPPKRWRVVLDLSKDDIDIEIEKGNPHLRVLDLMRQLVNSDGGIGALITWLPASLPALQAIDKMETEWEPLQASGQGRLEFSMKTIAWMSIEYTLKSSDGTPPDSKNPIRLEVKMEPRRSQAWWHVWRSDADPNSTDPISTALRPIWNQHGDNWLGLSTGAAGRPQNGVVNMLLAVDEAIREAVTNGASGTQGNEIVLD